MQKEIDNLEFVQGVHFEFINSLKNNGTRYLLFFDDSYAKISNSKEFVDIAGRHRGFSTIYIKHNLFHQETNWEGMLSCKAHTLFFSSPLEMGIKLLHHVYSWDFDQLSLTGIGMQHLYLLVIC